MFGMGTGVTSPSSSPEVSKVLRVSPIVPSKLNITINSHELSDSIL